MTAAIVSAKDIFIACPRASRCGSQRFPILVVGELSKVDAECAEFTIEVRAFDTDTLGELPDFAVAQHELLQKIGAFELLARFAQGQSEQILFHQRLAQ